jgi:hypothetical protein
VPTNQQKQRVNGDNFGSIYSVNPYQASTSETSQVRRTSEPHRITAMKYDPCGSGDILVSYSKGSIFLIRPSLGSVSCETETQRDSKCPENVQDEEPDTKENDTGSKDAKALYPDVVREYIGHRNERTMVT